MKNLIGVAVLLPWTSSLIVFFVSVGSYCWLSNSLIQSTEVNPPDEIANQIEFPSNDVFCFSYLSKLPCK